MDGWTTFPAKQEYHFHLPLPKKGYVRVYLLTKIKYSFFFFNGMTSQIHKLGVLQYFQ